jgi:hypothetical protein
MIEYPSYQAGANQFVRLRRAHLGKRVPELSLGLRIQMVKTRLIHMLAIHRRNPDQKIDKLRRPSLCRPRIAVERRHKEVAELSQCRQLLLSKKMRFGTDDGSGAALKSRYRLIAVCAFVVAPFAGVTGNIG